LEEIKGGRKGIENKKKGKMARRGGILASGGEKKEKRKNIRNLETTGLYVNEKRRATP